MSKRQVIDADGHILEDDTLVNFVNHAADEGFMPSVTLANLWPSLDYHHNGLYLKSKDAFGSGKKVGPPEWSKFIRDANLKWSVLYPTRGLGMGNITSPHWAGVVARAYNDWLYASYTKPDSRLKGMALLPMQDVPSAVTELRRAVKELGFFGAMLASNGLADHLGSKQYWPIYEEAERLGCSLAVHGGNHQNFGFDNFQSYTPKNGMGHPFGQMIALSSFVFHGALDEFPNLRIGFLEAGSAWVSLWMDRMDRSYKFHVDLDAAGKPVHLKLKMPSDYLTTGRIFVGCEGGEASLPAQIARVGNGPFLFASDFPHEVGVSDCLHEIEEIEESTELSEADKDAVLFGNAMRFYNYAGADLLEPVGAKAG